MQLLHQKINAFSLIELMIVVALIGMLSIIAVSGYYSYSVRSKLSEAFLLGAQKKPIIEEYFLVNDALPTTTQMSDSFSASSDSLMGNYVDKITYSYASNESNINIYLKNTTFYGSDAVTTTPILILKGIVDSVSKTISWTCTSTGIDSKYLPSNCQ